jgi:hypothetical protein
MQAEATGDLENMLQPAMHRLSQNTDHDEMTRKGNAYVGGMPQDRQLYAASMLSYANPFFLPAVSEKTAGDLAISLDMFAEYIMRAKMTIRRGSQPNVLLACAPKSASTFLHAALVRSLHLPPACLFASALDWGSAALHGSALREQEPDELALIRHGLNGRGYVAQHHTRCSPYLAQLLQTYNVRPIVTYRNLFDTIISVDDMVMQWRGKPDTIDYGYLADGLPGKFEHMPRSDRLMLLAQRLSAWLVQFYVSWRRCERLGHVRPLWISYEHDFLGDKAVLAARIAEFAGAGDATVIAAALGDKSGGQLTRLNKGVVGRGRDMPDDVRDYILSAARFYSEDEDMTPLISQ